MTNYQVLARKWRPRSFKDMVGQEPILRMLINAIDQQRLHHAYLLSGTRGVGKTTLGRIIAKCLNCETGITSTPCGTCRTCLDIDAGCFFDLFEVDAASRTKVEDTRELLENVPYPPAQGRYKIYLIDEVHMLSGHSFNALLKTLEEPPQHVKFILATTEPKRLPITILSRCLQFHLKPISATHITNHLQKICEEEKLSFESLALEQLSRAANGSARDALSLLDQAIVYTHGKLTLDEVQQMLGSVPHQDLVSLLQALANKNSHALMAGVARLVEQVADFNHVLSELVILLHKISLSQMVPGLTQADAAITQLAQQLTAEEVQLYYQIALIGRRDLSLAPSPELGLEMTLLRMLAFKPAEFSTAIPEKNNKPLATSNVPTIKAKPIAPPTNKPIENNTQASTEWQEIIPKLGLSGMPLALASNCSLKSLNDNKATLVLSANHKPMLNQRSAECIEQALTQYLNKPIKIDIRVSDEDLNTPMKQHLQEKENRLIAATEAINQDTNVKKLIDLFDAAIIKDTIQAIDPVG